MDGRRRRLVGLLRGISPWLLMLVLWIALGYAFFGWANGKPDVFVTLTLDVGAYDLRDGSCHGLGEFADIHPGSEVRVVDGAGRQAGRGMLGPGTSLGEARCLFLFALDIAGGRDSYALTVGGRGPVIFAWDDLRRDGTGKYTVIPLRVAGPRLELIQRTDP